MHLHHHAMHRAGVQVHHLLSHFVIGHRGVEEREIVHVVDVLEHVIVHPARRDGVEPAVVGAAVGRRAGHAFRVVMA